MRSLGLHICACAISGSRHCTVHARRLGLRICALGPLIRSLPPPLSGSRSALAFTRLPARRAHVHARRFGGQRSVGFGQLLTQQFVAALRVSTTDCVLLMQLASAQGAREEKELKNVQKGSEEQPADADAGSILD